MSKPATLSDDAHAVLQAAKLSDNESLSAVILRHVPRPIRTFGDMEKHLEQLEGPVIDRIDMEALARIKERRRRGNHAH